MRRHRPRRSNDDVLPHGLSYCESSFACGNTYHLRRVSEARTASSPAGSRPTRSAGSSKRRWDDAPTPLPATEVDMRALRGYRTHLGLYCCTRCLDVAFPPAVESTG